VELLQGSGGTSDAAKDFRTLYPAWRTGTPATVDTIIGLLEEGPVVMLFVMTSMNDSSQVIVICCNIDVAGAGEVIIIGWWVFCNWVVMRLTVSSSRVG
jgi:hypothetical protein